MNSWKLALVGLATVSASSFAAPLTAGSASAVKSSIKMVSIPDLGGEEIVILENLVTGEISVEGPNGQIVAGTELTADQVQKACYDCGPGGPGFVYGGGQLGYGGYGGGYVAPTIVERHEEEYYSRRSYSRRSLPPVAVPVPVPVPVPGYGGGYGGGYGPGPGYGGPDVGYGDGY